MTTPNSIRGHHHKGVTWKEVYKEEFAPHLYVVVTSSYEDFNGYEKQSGSSTLLVHAIVTNGKMFQWANGVLSYEGEKEWRAGLAPSSLEEYTTSRGWIVRQKVLFNGTVQNGDGTSKKTHQVGYYVEVPQKDIISLLTNTETV